MPHDDQGLARGPLDVQFGDLPGRAVVLRRLGRGSGVSHVDLQLAILEARQAPAVLVAPLIWGPDRAHPLGRQVGELLEQIVVDRPLAHNPHHPTHEASDLA